VLALQTSEYCLQKRAQSNPRSKGESARFVTIGGVYFDDGESSATKPTSSKSLDSVDTESTSGSGHSSGSADHHKGAPRIAKNFSQSRINPDQIQLSDDELAGRIMLKSRTLPKNSGYFSSNHVMINNERTKRGIAPRKRMPAFDEIARAVRPGPRPIRMAYRPIMYGP